MKEAISTGTTQFDCVLQVLIPPKDLSTKLQRASDNYRSVMDQVQYRVQWEKHQEMQRKKEEEQREKERGKQGIEKGGNVVLRK